MSLSQQARRDFARTASMSIGRPWDDSRGFDLHDHERLRAATRHARMCVRSLKALRRNVELMRWMEEIRPDCAMEVPPDRQN